MLNNKSIKILGIDPGIARTGYGIVLKHRNELSTKSYGCIETNKNEKTENRLKTIYNKLEKIILSEKPNEIAIEKLYFVKNVTNALTVAEARGVLLLLAAKKNIPLSEYNPTEIKQALTGYGRAEKIQMQKMVQTILNLKTIPKPDDTADALAIALCAHQTRKYRHAK